jgi:signal transduction histidine kinase
MSDASTKQFQEITQELYKKNIELVNANKEMALLQKLYETMAVKLNLEELSEEFLQIIVRDLDLQGGIVTLRVPNSAYIHCQTIYLRKNNEDFKRKYSVKLRHHISVSHEKDLFAEVFRDQKKTTASSLNRLFASLLDDKEIDELVELGEISSALLYPLSFGHHHIGVLTLFLKDTKLTEYDKQVLKQVSLVYGVALDRAMIYQDLKIANRELKKLDKLKDEFVSIASHELRTPLTAIKGYLWLALNKAPVPLPPEVNKNLQIAHNSTERLSRMVEDMLTISRIESNRLKLELADFDLVTLIQEVYNELAIRASAKNIQFTFDKKVEKVDMNGDKERVREAVINIVGNAMKFTPEGGKINLSLELKDKKSVIRVSDTGPGVTPEEKTKLFQKFSRLERSYEKTKESGSGLGLYITKQIVDLHNGSIDLESEVGEGTTFIISLPLKK